MWTPTIGEDLDILLLGEIFLELINLDVQKARLSALQALLKKQQKFFNGSFVNKKIEVIFDRKGRHKNQYIGRSIYNQSVFINSNIDLIGSIKQVRIKRSTDFALEAAASEH